MYPPHWCHCSGLILEYVVAFAADLRKCYWRPSRGRRTAIFLRTSLTKRRNWGRLKYTYTFCNSWDGFLSEWYWVTFRNKNVSFLKWFFRLFKMHFKKHLWIVYANFTFFMIEYSWKKTQNADGNCIGNITIAL